MPTSSLFRVSSSLAFCSSGIDVTTILEWQKLMRKNPSTAESVCFPRARFCVNWLWKEEDAKQRLLVRLL